MLHIPFGLNGFCLKFSHTPPAPPLSSIALFPIALLIFLGVFPKPLTEIVNPAVEHTMSDVQKKDPAPELEAAK